MTIDSRTARWDLTDMFTSDDEWEARFAKLEARYPEYERFRGRMAESAGVLHEFLTFDTEISIDTTMLWAFGEFRQYQDINDPVAQNMVSRMGNLWPKIIEAASYEFSEKAAISSEQFEAFVLQESRLEAWREALRKVRDEVAHVLAPDLKTIITQASAVMDMNNRNFKRLVEHEIEFGSFTTLTGESIEVTFNAYSELIMRPEREVREQTRKLYFQGLNKHRSSLSNFLETTIKKQVFLARMHKYPTGLAAAFEPAGLPESFFHDVIGTIQANLETWHPYYDLRRRVLGLEKLPLFDTRAPLNPNPVKVSFDQAVSWLLAALEPLGAEYVNQLERGINGGWFDLEPRSGRSNSGTAYWLYGTHPRIIMDYYEDIDSVSTLAHELGHAMHIWLTMKHQPHQYVYPHVLMCETAANTHQVLLRQYIHSNVSDEKIRLAFLEDEILFFYHHYLSLPMLSQLEFEAYSRVESGQALNADWLSERCAELYVRAFGPAVEQTDLGQIWMLKVMHNHFYGFQYLPASVAAEHVTHVIVTQGEPARDAYLKFLSSGSSVPQLEAFKLLGVDFSTPTAVESGFRTLKSRIADLEKMLKSTGIFLGKLG
jgi:oligoendopeptidase F